MLSDTAAFPDVEYFANIKESNVEIFDIYSVGHLICLYAYCGS